MGKEKRRRAEREEGGVGGKGREEKEREEKTEGRVGSKGTREWRGTGK